MNILDAIGLVLVGAVVVAGVSIIVAPQSGAANIITSFGGAEASLIKAAKG